MYMYCLAREIIPLYLYSQTNLKLKLLKLARVSNAADIFWLFDINIIIHQPNFPQGIVPSFKGYY